MHRDADSHSHRCEPQSYDTGILTAAASVQERNGRRVLLGTPGSPGRAHGTARVIAGPDDFHRFQPGDVLVAHTTTPVWTPLFNIAGAAVTEVGGPFAHAAIVAREFGIPLVTGAIDATHAITDGMPIAVDGSSGIAGPGHDRSKNRRRTTRAPDLLLPSAQGRWRCLTIQLPYQGLFKILLQKRE